MVRAAVVVTNPCAPDPRVLRHARWLSECGFSVTVHAFDRGETHPMSENHHGVRIMRYRLGQHRYGGSYATYRGIRAFQRQVLRTLHHEPPALVYCHDADTLRIGVDLARRFGTPYVFDMHDLQHTWALHTRPKSLVRKQVASGMRRRMLKRAKGASAIITTSLAGERYAHPGFVEWLKGQGLVSTCVENRPLPPFAQEKSPPKDGWTVGYTGRIRDVEPFELLLQSIALLPEHDRPSVLIAGDGVAAQKVTQKVEEAAEQGLLHATISGAFDRKSLMDHLSKVDVMYAMYPDSRFNILQGALPVKMFDAASAGIPSVVNEGCLMGDVVTAEGLGLAVKYGDIQALADALLACKDRVVMLQTTGEQERERWMEAMDTVLKSVQ